MRFHSERRCLNRFERKQRELARLTFPTTILRFTCSVLHANHEIPESTITTLLDIMTLITSGWRRRNGNLVWASSHGSEDHLNDCDISLWMIPPTTHHILTTIHESLNVYVVLLAAPQKYHFRTGGSLRTCDTLLPNYLSLLVILFPTACFWIYWKICMEGEKVEAACRHVLECGWLRDV